MMRIARRFAPCPSTTSCSTARRSSSDRTATAIFTALRTKRGAAKASFVPFDLLQVDGEDRRKLALKVRRAELESLVAGLDAIEFSEAIDAEGAVVSKACELGLEGIVSKRLGGAY
jgi:ATP-dependent DNA ligase